MNTVIFIIIIFALSLAIGLYRSNKLIEKEKKVTLFDGVALVAVISIVLFLFFKLIVEEDKESGAVTIEGSYSCRDINNNLHKVSSSNGWTQKRDIFIKKSLRIPLEACKRSE